MSESRIEVGAGGQSFVGREAVELYRLAVLASALKLYGQHGIRANRGYTPTRMLQAASQALGVTFKRGAYLQAAEALLARVDELKASIPVVTR